MQLAGIHHVTAITADAQRNLDFYAGVLGLRFVKKTVNFDAPDVYHLYYGDELGAPGSAMTFFEFPDAAPGRAGAGIVHTVTWRVSGPAALEFWAERLAGAGVTAERSGAALGFADPEGLGLELRAADVPDAPLAAAGPGIPAEHALLGFHGARAYASDPRRSDALLERLGFAAGPAGGWELAGQERTAAWGYDPAPAEPGVQGAGTVHHIAWQSRDEDLAPWRDTVRAAGARATDVIDRTYFRSVYFREPSGVLFELATPSPGFTVDEPAETLGEALSLPPQHEHLRAQLECRLTPLVHPRDRATAQT